MKDLASLAVTREQFILLAELCRHDGKFPGDWAEWNRMTAPEVDPPPEEPAPPPQFDVEHFRAWCHRVRIVPCIDALRAYAIVVRSTAARSRYGTFSLD
jgi:hypothetical protein